MPVGDSTAAGYTDNPTWSVPFGFGYRRPLYELLTAAGKSFAFVGQSDEPFNGAFGQPNSVLTPDLRDIDIVQNFHNGYGGAGTAFVDNNIVGWLQDDPPDIVLLLIGINDITPEQSAEPIAAKVNLASIVAKIQGTAPSAKVFVAKITPYTTATPAIDDYNDFIDTLEGVTVVDLHANFIDGEGDIITSLFSNGINHHTADADELNAQSWYDAIIGVIP